MNTQTLNTDNKGAHMKTSQRQAIYETITTYIREHKGIELKDYMNASKLLTKSDKEAVVDILTESFKSGMVKHKFSNVGDRTLRAIVKRLMFNWLRRDSRLNGGYDYNRQLKRKAARDWYPNPQLEALDHLRSIVSDPDSRSLISRHYITLLLKLRACKKKGYKFDVSDLPDDPELKRLVRKSILG